MGKKRQSRDPLQQGTWFGIPPEPERPATLLEVTMFEGHPLRIIYIKGVPWWVLTDLARILGYRDARDASLLVREKHRGTGLVRTPGGEQEMLTVSEPGLYRLMMRSDKPEAERFQDWICEEVIPTIRRTGSYTMPLARTSRMMRKLGCDGETAMARCKQVDTNKSLHSHLARRKAPPRCFQRVHNGIYGVQFGGRDAKGMRKDVGARSRDTPLDHMAEIPLTINLLAKAIGLRALNDRDDAGAPVPLDEVPSFLEAEARKCIEANLTALGPDASFDPRDDPKRGRVFDVVRKQIVA